jgi:Methylamine utilisation protein MauE
MWVGLVSAGFAVFFGASSLTKMDSWSSWRESASGWMPSPFRSTVVFAAFPAGELAVAMILSLYPRYGLLAAAALLGGFGAGVLAMPASWGKTCGCFGRGTSGRIGPRLAIRNLLLGSGAAGAFFAAQHQPSGRLPIPGLLMVALAALIVLLWWESRNLRGIVLQLRPAANMEEKR